MRGASLKANPTKDLKLPPRQIHLFCTAMTTGLHLKLSNQEQHSLIYPESPSPLIHTGHLVLVQKCHHYKI